jgi:protein-disulfide isomerase
VKKSNRSRNLIALVVVITAAVGAFAVYGFSGKGGGTQSTSTINPQLAYLQISPNTPVLGSKTAPVTIFEFGDLQCPTCDYWFKTQESQVVKNLVDTGKAKLVWKDFDYYGPDSTSASKALYAAGVQGKFWNYYDLLWTKQGNINSGWASPDNLKAFAQQLGLNITQFNIDFNGGKYTPLINSNYSDGQALGVNGTPTFFLVGPGGRIVQIVGAQPYSVFESEVNSLTG